MKKQIKKINPAHYDEWMMAELSQNKTRLKELEETYQGQLYKYIEVDVPVEVPYAEALLDIGLEEYEENIYAGIASGSMYSFDFNEKIVSVSIVLMDNYVILTEHKRVFFSSNLYKNAYLLVNYETGEEIDYKGPKSLKELLLKEFDYKQAIDNILNCSKASSLEELFK